MSTDTPQDEPNTTGVSATKDGDSRHPAGEDSAATSPLLYANDVLAALIVISFVAFLSAGLLGSLPSDLFSNDTWGSILVAGTVSIVVATAVWVFGPQTMVAVAKLTKASIVPERLVPESAGNGKQDDQRARSQEVDGEAGSDKEQEARGGSVHPDPIAGHPQLSSDKRWRRRMIQSEWRPLDIVLAFVILAPLLIILMTPLAHQFPTPIKVGEYSVPLSVFFIHVALGVLVVGWVTHIPIVSTVILAAVLTGFGLAAFAPSIQMLIKNANNLPEVFMLVYFVLTLTVVVWAFGERAAEGIAAFRRG